MHCTPCIDDRGILVGGASLSSLSAYRSKDPVELLDLSPPSLLSVAGALLAIKVKREMRNVSVSFTRILSRFLHLGGLP